MVCRYCGTEKVDAHFCRSLGRHIFANDNDAWMQKEIPPHLRGHVQLQHTIPICGELKQRPKEKTVVDTDDDYPSTTLVTSPPPQVPVIRLPEVEPDAGFAGGEGVGSGW